MQNWVAPAACVRRAAATMSSRCRGRTARTGVAKRADCEQNAQSSGQPPDLTERSLDLHLGRRSTRMPHPWASASARRRARPAAGGPQRLRLVEPRPPRSRTLLDGRCQVFMRGSRSGHGPHRPRGSRPRTGAIGEVVEVACAPRGRGRPGRIRSRGRPREPRAPIASTSARCGSACRGRLHRHHERRVQQLGDVGDRPAGRRPTSSPPAPSISTPSAPARSSRAAVTIGSQARLRRALEARRDGRSDGCFVA